MGTDATNVCVHVEFVLYWLKLFWHIMQSVVMKDSECHVSGRLLIYLGDPTCDAARSSGVP